jgi:hypothetical protein
MIGGGGFQMPDAFLAMSPDVQKDIKVTDAQKKSLDTLQQEMMSNMPGRGGQGGGGGQRRTDTGGAERQRGGGGFDPSQWRTMMDDMAKKINDVLDDKQEARLFQIGVQTAGGRALFREDVQKKLDMKAAQKKALEDLQAKMQEATMQLFQRMQAEEIDREQMQESMRKNGEILNTEAAKVLTPEQAKAFEVMKGPKFEGQAGMGMFGGRRGGGGAGGGGGRPPRTGGAGQPPVL